MSNEKKPYSLDNGTVTGPGVTPIVFGRQFAGPACTPVMLKCCGDLNKAYALGVEAGRKDAEPALSGERDTAIGGLAKMIKELRGLALSIREQAESLADKHSE